MKFDPPNFKDRPLLLGLAASCLDGEVAEAVEAAADNPIRLLLGEANGDIIGELLLLRFSPSVRPDLPNLGLEAGLAPVPRGFNPGFFNGGSDFLPRGASLLPPPKGGNGP